MKDETSKLVEKDDSVSLKQRTEKVNLMGLRCQKSLLEST